MDVKITTFNTYREGKLKLILKGKVMKLKMIADQIRRFEVSGLT